MRLLFSFAGSLTDTQLILLSISFTLGIYLIRNDRWVAGSSPMPPDGRQCQQFEFLYFSEAFIFLLVIREDRQ